MNFTLTLVDQISEKCRNFPLGIIGCSVPKLRKRIGCSDEGIVGVENFSFTVAWVEVAEMATPSIIAMINRNKKAAIKPSGISIIFL